MTFESCSGVPSIGVEIQSILEKSEHTNITKDFKINITVKDGIVDDLKINMQHKKIHD